MQKAPAATIMLSSAFVRNKHMPLVADDVTSLTAIDGTTHRGTAFTNPQSATLEVAEANQRRVSPDLPLQRFNDFTPPSTFRVTSHRISCSTPTQGSRRKSEM
jgi:hypothetical protein